MFRSTLFRRCATKEVVSSSSSSSSSTTAIQGNKIGNRFAATPSKRTERWVINLAAEKHQGWGIYKSKQDVIDVLQALRVTKPEWWCKHCDHVLARMLALSTNMNSIGAKQKKGAIIVVEGLDGVGKSTCVSKLAQEADADSGYGDEVEGSEYVSSFANSSATMADFFPREKDPHELALEAELKRNQHELQEQQKQNLISSVIPGAVLVRTPSPRFDLARAKFRVLEDPIARAFYCACNYIAADEVIKRSQDRVVVLDRWWASTCAMALTTRASHLSQAAIADRQREEERKRQQQQEEKEGSSGGGGGDQKRRKKGLVARWFESSPDLDGMVNTSISSSPLKRSHQSGSDVQDPTNMLSLLPPQGAACLHWPNDMPLFDLAVLLDCPEEVRKKRMAKRGDENAEEKKLAEQNQMRDCAKEAYMRMYPKLEVVQVFPNYASAVNEIVDKIESSPKLRSLMPHGMPKKYSQDFIDSVPSF